MIPKTLRGVWIERAACKGTDMLLTTHTKQQAYYERRKVDRDRINICRSCPVLEDCTDWVMSEVEDPCPFHIVAAMCPCERGRIRRYGRQGAA